MLSREQIDVVRRELESGRTIKQAAETINVPANQLKFKLLKSGFDTRLTLVPTGPRDETGRRRAEQAA